MEALKTCAFADETDSGVDLGHSQQDTIQHLIQETEMLYIEALEKDGSSIKERKKRGMNTLRTDSVWDLEAYSQTSMAAFGAAFGALFVMAIVIAHLELNFVSHSPFAWRRVPMLVIILFKLKNHMRFSFLGGHLLNTSL